MAQGAHDPQVERWRPLIERYFRASDVDYAMMLMWGESQGNPGVANPGSSRVGLFQMPLASWTERIKQVRAFWAAKGVEVPYNVWDPEAQIATAAWLRYQSEDPKAGGWTNWYSARTYYPPGSWKPGETYWDGYKYTNTNGEGSAPPPWGTGKAAGTPGGLIVGGQELGLGFLNPLPGAADPGPGSLFGDPRTGHIHAGIDLSQPEGTPIQAAQSGVVVFSGMLNDSAGRAVVIRHPNGWTTHYFHCSGELVQVGDQVMAGQAVALVGQTGNASGPHLHFETRYNGKPVDPLSLNLTRAEQPFDMLTAEQQRQLSPVQAQVLGSGLYEPTQSTLTGPAATFTGIVDAMSNAVAGGQRRSVADILAEPTLGEIIRPGEERMNEVLEEGPV